MKVYLRLDEEMADLFSRIKKHLGVKNDTEVVRSLINWYGREHEEELRPRFNFLDINKNELGVLLYDKESKRSVQILIRPEKIECEACQTNNCPHIEYALTKPEVKEVIRKKRREGWNLPEA